MKNMKALTCTCLNMPPFGLNDMSTESTKCSPLLAKANIQVGCFDGVRISTITSVACAFGPGVTISSTDFSFQNLVFWNLFELSAAQITLKFHIYHILISNLTK